MKKIKNDSLIKALFRQPVNQTPVWLMRQAGRYLPEYQAIRHQAGSFLALCKTPELACEVTLQPIRRFHLDAAIVFSDILTLPDAMGLGLYFVEGEGPKFQKAFTLQDIPKLKPLDIQKDLQYTLKAVAYASNELHQNIPLIGFSGSPWTLACYMLEGGASKTFIQARAFAYQAPEALHVLLNYLAETIGHYLHAQAESGADVLMLFDTWGGLLTPKHYQLFSLYYMKAIIKYLKAQPLTAQIPIILFTKQGGAWIEWMAESGCDAIGLDWSTNLQQAKQRIGHKVALQGNFDPALLFSSPEHIRNTVKEHLSGYDSHVGYIANLGHGIEPTTPPENVEIFIEAIHTFKHEEIKP